MKIRVSELIVKYLERLGIEYIFGMPGAHILPVYDSLYGSGIKSVLAKHEQGAAFMAGGYARVSGKIAACITTAGPGATNLVTGVANAYADRQPLLIITGETSTHIFGKGGLQESSGEGGSIDQLALFKGITRYNRIVERTDYLVNVLNQASRILLSANPGPVLLSFPFNIQKEWVDDAILDGVTTARNSHAGHNAPLPVDALADLIMEARSPVIVAGHGCIESGAQGFVAELSESLNIPVTTSLKGKGIVSEQSPLSLGSLGVTSSGRAYEYLAEVADLLIILGAGFNERTSYSWNQTLLTNRKIVQVDNDHDQLEKVFKADLAINGDIGQLLTGVLDRLKERGTPGKSFEKSGGCSKGVEKRPIETMPEGFLADFHLVEQFFEKLEQHFPAGIMVFDDNIIFAQNFFHVSRENRYFPNSGISSLGHAIPAAIGAGFAQRVPTFAILGDGGFQMCCMEIMTAVNYDLPLNVVMFNNSTMGLIRKNQAQQYDGRFIDCDFVNPDYCQLAKSFGINYKRVDSEHDLGELFADFDFSNSINLIEVMIDKNAFPNYTTHR